MSRTSNASSRPFQTWGIPFSGPLRLAYFSPLPPARSGIADYSMDLLSHLQEYASLTLYAGDPAGVAQEVRSRFRVRALEVYAEERWQYDVALYQMGNSMHHEGMYKVMCRYPGILVLHDAILHHFVAHRTAGQGNHPAYTREIAYALGIDGANRLWARRFGRRDVSLATPTLSRRVLDLSLGVLVHSQYARRQVAALQPRQFVQVIAAPMRPLSGPLLRHRLPWPSDAIIFATFGQMTDAKQVDRALQAFARLHQEVPTARYLLVGESGPEADIQSLQREYGLGQVVFSTGYVPDLKTFGGWLQTADVVVNLRHPTQGETSAVALRALAAGRPLVVYDHGWYAELPDKVAMKVAPLDDEALLAAMHTLATDAERRRRMGERGRVYALANHTPREAARAYAAAIRRILTATVETDLVAGAKRD